MHSRYLGYSSGVKSLAFLPSVLGFALFFVLVAAYGRINAREDEGGGSGGGGEGTTANAASAAKEAKEQVRYKGMRNIIDSLLELLLLSLRFLASAVGARTRGEEEDPTTSRWLCDDSGFGGERKVHFWRIRGCDFLAL